MTIYVPHGAPAWGNHDWASMLWDRSQDVVAAITASGVCTEQEPLAYRMATLTRLMTRILKARGDW